MIQHRNLNARRIVEWITLFAVACGSCTAASFDAWQFQQVLRVNLPGLTRVQLTPETYHAAQMGLSDLRLLDAAGAEVSHLILRPEQASERTRRVENLDIRLEARSTQMVIPLTNAPGLRSLRIETPAVEFMKAVTLEAVSTDGSVRTLTTRQAWFRQRGAERLIQSILPLDTNVRALRLTLDDSRSAPIAITAVYLQEEESPVVVPVPVEAAVVDRQEGASETRITLNLGKSHLPAMAIRFQTLEPVFLRTVRVINRQWKETGLEDQMVAQGSIHRLSLGNADVAEGLEIPGRFTCPSAEIILSIDNGDSPPLNFTRVEVLCEPIQLMFYGKQAGVYTLLSGNPEARVPRYDLAAFGREARRSPGTVAVLEAATLRASYQMPSGLTDAPTFGGVADPTQWRFRKTVILAHDGVQRLKLPLHTLANCRPDYSDIRLISEGRQVLYITDHSRLFVPVDVSARVVPVPNKPRLTRWQLTLPMGGLPLTRIRCEAASALFDRNLRIWDEREERGVEPRERELGRARWIRTPDSTRRQFDIELPGSPAATTLWLETDNGDNAALELKTFQAFVPGIQLLFQSQTSNRVELCYGKADADRPSYDLNLIAPRVVAAVKHEALVGGTGLDPGPAPTRGSLSVSVIFYGVLAAVVIGLVFVISRLVPKTGSAGN